MKSTGRSPVSAEQVCAASLESRVNDFVDSFASEERTNPNQPDVNLPKPRIPIPTFQSTDGDISFLDLMHVILDQSEAVHVGLLSFCRSSFRPCSPHSAQCCCQR